MPALTTLQTRYTQEIFSDEINEKVKKMGLTWLKNIASKIDSKQSSLFTYPVQKQQAYVAHFPEPKDGIERGYFQYCCQMKLTGQPIHFFTNLAALPLSLFYLATYPTANVTREQASDAVFFPDGKPFNIIPDSLQAQYKNIVSLSTDGKLLSKEDRHFLTAIFRKYPVSWLLWLKVIIKLAQYSHAITKYSPKAIISCNEYSYTAPILTEYCHTRGVKLINVMHGEKLYYMRDSFMSYDEYYVWDQHYVDLLTDLGAKKEQFRVELPGSMRIQKQDDISIQYDYTCYLQNENEDRLRALAGALRSLYDQGKRLSVRPHPRYSNINLVKQLFDFANIEDCKTVTIEQSLLQTGAAISLYSTVLNQAVSNSIPVVIDDISNPERFKKLKELRYACLSKEHTLLSEIAKNA